MYLLVFCTSPMSRWAFVPVHRRCYKIVVYYYYSKSRDVWSHSSLILHFVKWNRNWLWVFDGLRTAYYFNLCHRRQRYAAVSPLCILSLNTFPIFTRHVYSVFVWPSFARCFPSLRLEEHIWCQRKPCFWLDGWSVTVFPGCRAWHLNLIWGSLFFARWGPPHSPSDTFWIVSKVFPSS